MMEKVYITAAKRSAIGAFNGSLANVPTPKLGAEIAKSVLSEGGLPPGAISALICGNVLSAGLGQGMARQVSLGAGLPVSTPAYSSNMVCGSGLLAVVQAYGAIRAGLGGAFIAGGAENMSAAPYLLPGARQGFKMNNKELVDHMVHDALTDAFEGFHMGATAENVAKKHEITREEQDGFAYESQRKAIAAVDCGAFEAEIAPVNVKAGKAETVFRVDEYPNRSSTPEKLSKLKPCFLDGGTVTAGNSSGINDGAAFLLVVSESELVKYSLKPLGEIAGTGFGGVFPAVMGLGAVPAINQALASARMTLDEIEILELNEAFAAQSLGVIKELSEVHGVPAQSIFSKTNLRGGAIALGHPVGASGARILVTLLHLMKAKEAKAGLAALCVGGGQGVSVVVKRSRF